MRTPRSVEIELTARCNLRCTYCHFFDNPSVEHRDVSTGERLQFFDCRWMAPSKGLNRLPSLNPIGVERTRALG
jgi:MoaA/NifB/PqqE/SkfB family radical SAM enzyme